MVSTTPDATDSRHTTARQLGIPIIISGSKLLRAGPVE